VTSQAAQAQSPKQRPEELSIASHLSDGSGTSHTRVGNTERERERSELEDRIAKIAAEKDQRVGGGGSEYQRTAAFIVDIRRKQAIPWSTARLAYSTTSPLSDF
jgi:hypothetical protein